MEKKAPVDLIIRNIASNGTEYAKEIREWLENSAENKRVYHDLLALWRITGSFPNRFFPDKAGAWTNVQRHIHLQKRKYVLYHRIAQVAAAVILVFLSVWAGTKLDHWRERPLYTEVFSPVGQKTRLILPDRSMVMLNGGSKIRYSQDFNRRDRYVELQGEGYFEVQKNRDKRFVVHTAELDIRVHGTSFNVKAYEGDQTVEVGLEDGLVGITRDEEEILQLTPGMVATFKKNEAKFDVGKMDMNLVSAWTRNELVFEESPMEEIVQYMERWYGVAIRVSPEIMNGELLTFKVKTESLQEVLNRIKMLTPIRYRIDGGQVIITKP